MKHLFAYGTLMCEDIFHDVSGCRRPHISGYLCGYSRRAVKEEPYPAIFPDENGVTKGIVYLHLPEPAWQLLDRFEGDMYHRNFVRVESEDGRIISAMAYVIQPEFLNLLEPFEWNFENFLKNGKHKFRKYYKA